MVQGPRRTSGTGLEIEMVVEREERAKAVKVVAEWRLIMLQYLHQSYMVFIYGINYVP
jgi:hypothetical protein